MPWGNAPKPLLLYYSFRTSSNSELAPQSGPILVFNVKLGLGKAKGKPIQEEQSG